MSFKRKPQVPCEVGEIGLIYTGCRQPLKTASNPNSKHRRKHLPHTSMGQAILRALETSNAD